LRAGAAGDKQSTNQNSRNTKRTKDTKGHEAEFRRISETPFNPGHIGFSFFVTRVKAFEPSTR